MLEWNGGSIDRDPESIVAQKEIRKNSKLQTISKPGIVHIALETDKNSA